MKYSVVFSLLLLSACSSTGIVPMDDGVYMIAQRSAQVGFGPPDGVKRTYITKPIIFALILSKKSKQLN
jgi:hypothetical protein